MNLRPYQQQGGDPLLRLQLFRPSEQSARYQLDDC